MPEIVVYEPCWADSGFVATKGRRIRAKWMVLEKAPRFCSIIMVHRVQARILGRQEDTDRPISRAGTDSVCLAEQQPWTVSLVSRGDHERALRCLGMQTRIDMYAVISIRARLHNFSSGSLQRAVSTSTTSAGFSSSSSRRPSWTQLGQENIVAERMSSDGDAGKLLAGSKGKEPLGPSLAVSHGLIPTLSPHHPHIVIVKEPWTTNNPSMKRLSLRA